MEALTFKNIMFQMFYVQARSPFDNAIFDAVFELFQHDKKEFFELVAKTLPKEYFDMMPCRKTSYLPSANWYHDQLCALTHSLQDFFEDKEYLIIESPEPDPIINSGLMSGEDIGGDYLWHLIYSCIIINSARELNIPSSAEGFNMYDGIHEGFILIVAEWTEYYKELLISKYG